MKCLVCLIALLSSLCVLAQTDAQIHEQFKLDTLTGSSHGYESPPTLKAGDFVDADLRDSELYTIEEDVINNGHMNLYRVQSEYGNYDVIGNDHLRILLHELDVLHELESFSKSSMFVDKTKDLGVRTINAPINAVKISAHLVSNPDEIYETVKKIPAGIGRVFGFAGRTTKKAAVSASQALTNNGEEGAEEDNDGPSAAQQTATKSKEFAYDYIGQSRNMQEWLDHYAVDPFTSNTLLLDQIKWIVSIETSVDVGFSFVPGLGAISVVGDINRYYSMAKDVTLFESPDVRKAANRQKFLDFGQEEAEIDAFFDNPKLTPTTQNIIINTLTALEGVDNRDALLDSAVQIESEAGRLFYSSLAVALHSYHLNETRLTALIDGAVVPAAISADNELIIILPADYLIWTDLLETGLKQLLKRAKQAYSVKRTKVLVSGQTSERCSAELKARGVNLAVNVKYSMPEPEPEPEPE